MFLSPLQCLDGLVKLLIGEPQVLLRLMVFAHVPGEASELYWSSGFPVNFCARGQGPNRTVWPDNAEFRLVFRATFERSGEILLEAFAVARVHQRGKLLHGSRKNA